jgi:hypothetical protein
MYELPGLMYAAPDPTRQNEVLRYVEGICMARWAATVFPVDVLFLYVSHPACPASLQKHHTSYPLAAGFVKLPVPGLNGGRPSPPQVLFAIVPSALRANCVSPI